MQTDHATEYALWLRQFHPTPSAPVRLVCFPHAGGSASYYFPVSRALAPSVEVLAVQYPGRQDRRAEPGITSIGELTERIAPLLGADPRPLALFGHSMGATLAFEVARELERSGTEPLVLFVSGRRPPVVPRRDVVPMTDADLLAEIRKLDGTDSRVYADVDIRAMALAAVRTDYTAAGSYEYEPGRPLRTPIEVHVGDSDPKVTVAEAERWQECTTGGFECTVYPGGHFYLDTHAARLTAAVSESLAARYLAVR
jgi:surfactin synthase thioesterase subunit